MKIALLSYHFWYNYGTCLQAYALWFMMTKCGVVAEYLDFGWRYPGGLEPYLECHYSYLRPPSSFLCRVKYFLCRYKNAIRNKTFRARILRDLILMRNNIKFDAFKKFIPESRPLDLDSDGEVLGRYDRFVVGSDQVWNPDCSDEKYVKRFLLDFVRMPHQKFCYAPSIGRDSVSGRAEELFRCYLSSFANVCCRESSGCIMLSRILGRNVEQVLDPTFLLRPEEWRQTAIYSRGNANFVLCYVLGSKERVVQYALNLAQKLGVELKVVTENFHIIDRFGKHVIGGVGPREFVGLIDRSQFVVTDSFHGCALSINFNKSFRAFLKRGGDASTSDNGRIPALLSQFKLTGCLCPDSAAIDISPTDFGVSNHILEVMRKKSVAYLKDVVLK